MLGGWGMLLAAPRGSHPLCPSPGKHPAFQSLIYNLEVTFSGSQVGGREGSQHCKKKPTCSPVVPLDVS